MKKREIPMSIWLSAGTITIIIIVSVIFYKKGSDFAYWIPLLVAVLNCIVTIMSQREVLRSKEVQDEKAIMPYLILSYIKTWYGNEEEDFRFPWGGDPEPQDVYPYFLKESETNLDGNELHTIYIQAALQNIGAGIARNISVSTLDDENGKLIPVLANDKTRLDQFYFQVGFYDGMDSFTRKLIISFESLSGIKYRQFVDCNISIYDYSVLEALFCPSLPEVFPDNE